MFPSTGAFFLDSIMSGLRRGLGWWRENIVQNKRVNPHFEILLKLFLAPSYCTCKIFLILIPTASGKGQTVSSQNAKWRGGDWLKRHLLWSHRCGSRCLARKPINGRHYPAILHTQRHEGLPIHPQSIVPFLIQRPIGCPSSRRHTHTLGKTRSDMFKQKQMSVRSREGGWTAGRGGRGDTS